MSHPNPAYKVPPMNPWTSKPFHLAIEGGDLSVTVPFYTEALCCNLGWDGEEGRYQDIDFWGNELTLHESTPRESFVTEIYDVDMGRVMVPHLGIHLSEKAWDAVLESIKTVVPESIIEEPFTRYEGTKTEQTTFFVRDPNWNVIELKYFKL